MSEVEKTMLKASQLRNRDGVHQPVDCKGRIYQDGMGLKPVAQ